MQGAVAAGTKNNAGFVQQRCACQRRNPEVSAGALLPSFPPLWNIRSLVCAPTCMSQGASVAVVMQQIVYCAARSYKLPYAHWPAVILAAAAYVIEANMSSSF